MSEIICKVYKYDSSQEANGYRGEDFSNYAILGYQFSDNLDDTLDNFELTLNGLSFREEFVPKTKFIIEIYERTQNPITGEYTTTLWNNRALHFEVDTDIVTQPILSDDNYFKHTISFIEPSANMQGRLVDNVSVTYKLKDITLDVLPAYDSTLKTNLIQTSTPITTVNFKDKRTLPQETIQGHLFEWEYPDWYDVTIDGETMTPKQWWLTHEVDFYQQLTLLEASKTIYFPTPMLKASSSIIDTKTYRKNGYCSIDCIITSKNLSTGETATETLRIDPVSDATEGVWAKDAMWETSNEGPQNFGWIVSRKTWSIFGDARGTYLSKIAETVEARQNRTIPITIYPNYQYTISFSLHNFNLENISGSGLNGHTDATSDNYYHYDDVPAYYSYAYTKISWGGLIVKNNHLLTTSAMPQAFMTFQSVRESDNKTILVNSAPPATAYDLFNKATLTTQTFDKKENIIIDETPKQVYLSEENKALLKDTTIVENFYNQKNLWEVYMDVGKYIHARPILRFGEDKKYLMEFKKYGKTDKQEDKSTHISIYNSRMIEDYICSVSSYVENMVQMGGEVTEILVPKSSSEDYLVYNDVAELQTTKNIIEIIELNVIDNDPTSPYYGQKRGLTGNDPNVQSYTIQPVTGNLIPTGNVNTSGFVFEETIYNILDIVPTVNINKGVAIYYTLGTNKIKGFTYQLPTINRGDFWADYAIKQIIGIAFGLTPYSNWKDIKINNYLFEIRYRTQDSLRSDQSRPDLRHYLLSTPYDNVPQHSQFNNQTDIVVDSAKFGNNNYGKLIRTGNSFFVRKEWVNSPSELKESGDLCIIDGDWYYVSRVLSTFYSNHIISEVEYSKDFNRLSQVIGIPSEPRFSEIGIQSQIHREVNIPDYVVLDTKIQENDGKTLSFLKNKSMDYIGSLLFSPRNHADNLDPNLSEETFYPKYAVTVFKNDADKVIQQGGDLLYKEICSPLSTYTLQNSLTIEWDMKDNVSAGDKVNLTNLSIPDRDVIDTAYATLSAVKYTDKYNRADLYDFAIIDDYTMTPAEAQNLPNNPIAILPNKEHFLFGNHNDDSYGGNYNGLALLKDNREKISFNYNLQMLTGSDRFVLSAYMWQKNKTNMRIALLNEEVNKISNDTIPNSSFAVIDLPFTYETNEETHTIKINIETALLGISNEQLLNTKAIVVYSNKQINDLAYSNSKYFIMARNIGDLTSSQARENWYISPYSKSMFFQQ